MGEQRELPTRMEESKSLEESRNRVLKQQPLTSANTANGRTFKTELLPSVSLET